MMRLRGPSHLSSGMMITVSSGSAGSIAPVSSAAVAEAGTGGCSDAAAAVPLPRLPFAAGAATRCCSLDTTSAAAAVPRLPFFPSTASAGSDGDTPACASISGVAGMVLEGFAGSTMRPATIRSRTHAGIHRSAQASTTARPSSLSSVRACPALPEHLEEKLLDEEVQHSITDKYSILTDLSISARSRRCTSSGCTCGVASENGWRRCDSILSGLRSGCANHNLRLSCSSQPLPPA